MVHRETDSSRAGASMIASDAPPAPRVRADHRESTDGPRRLTHLPALDGLRGVAVLAVVLYHFAPGFAPGGFLGVDLFFVLSGFLITSLLVGEWQTRRLISLRSFWARRARRLLPALFLVLAAIGAYVVIATNQVDGQHIAVDGLSALGYVANWHFISSGQSYIQQFVQQAPSPVRHMWSLAIEEQFYLVWPIVVVLTGKVALRARRGSRLSTGRFRHAVVVVCIALGTASFVRMVTLFRAGGDPNRVYYGTDTRAFIILIGALLGALSVGAPTVTRRLRGPLVALGGISAVALAAAVARVSIASSWLYRGGYAAVAVLMVVVLAAAAQPGPNPLGRLLSLRPLVGLGLISYGVYLWHWPIGLWITPSSTGVSGPLLFGLRSLVTLAAALASYVLVEQPIRRGRYAPWRRPRRAIVPAVAVLAVAVALLVPALAFPSVASVPDVGATSPPTAGALAVTARYATAPQCDPAPAGLAPTAQPARVQLIGNSIAEEIRPCLATILAARGAHLEGVSPNGFVVCHILSAVRDQVRNPATRPDAAILFGFIAGDPRCGRDWTVPVQRLLRIWQAAGVPVYLIPSVPFVPGSPREQTLRGGPAAEARYYRRIARLDPARLTVLDAGTFLRDTQGRYLWRMPCLAGEPGCGPHGTVGVRWTDGFHYCTDPGFAAHGCPHVEFAAGERRAAAAIAAGLLPTLVATGGP